MKNYEAQKFNNFFSSIDPKIMLAKEGGQPFFVFCFVEVEDFFGKKNKNKKQTSKHKSDTF